MESITLQDCFDAFRQDEQLSAQDMWYCPNCKTHVRAFKKMDLWSLPDVFIVHLKRFQYQQGMYMMLRDKITCQVDFPIEGLEMSSFIVGPSGGPVVYDLFAVSEHSGGLGGGHYTAVAKNSESGLWYDFNDSSCRQTRPEHAVSPQAYVLFYQRRQHTHKSVEAPDSAEATT